MNFDIIILAAGMGTRTGLPYSKLAAEINGKPLICFSAAAEIDANPSDIVVVTNSDNDDVEKALGVLGYPFKFAKQQLLAGTADALQTGLEFCKADCLVVINGDMPLVIPEIIEKIASFQAGIDEAFIYTKPDSPGNMGRVFFEGDDFRIIEAHEPADGKTEYVNSGVYFFRRAFLEANIDKLNANNKKNELYITDLFNLKANKKAVFCEDWKSLSGVNSLKEFEFAAKALRDRKIDTLFEKGVIIYDRETVYIESDVEVGNSTVIYPYSVLKGGSKIGKKCVIESFSTVLESEISDNVIIKSGSYIEGSIVGEKSVIGPMAHLRPGSVVGQLCRVGNFVETKKAVLKEGVKASHLSYLGDCEIGRETNIGCGTITCNYDGFEKHKTVIGSNVFIGSDSQLVAPVKIGDAALIAAGSTITEDVPRDALAISRANQKNIPGGAARFRKKRQS